MLLLFTDAHILQACQLVLMTLTLAEGYPDRYNLIDSDCGCYTYSVRENDYEYFQGFHFHRAKMTLSLDKRSPKYVCLERSCQGIPLCQVS